MRSIHYGILNLGSCCCLAAMFLAGCAAVDGSVSERALTLNTSSGDYASQAILTNLIRAQKYEPLSFASLTSFTGHNTLSGGLPSTTLPATMPAVTIDHNLLSGSIENDFNVNPLDDPQSYEALFTPVNPYVISIFIKAGYPRELIYLLFVDYVERLHGAERYLYFNLPERSKTNDDGFKTLEGTTLNDFIIHPIENLAMQSGLTILSDVDSTPGASYVPSYVLCFDADLPFPVQEHHRFEFPSSSVSLKPSCKDKDLNWTKARPTNPTYNGKSIIAHPFAFYEVHAGSYTYKIHTRSLVGVYNYLGRVIDLKDTVPLKYADTEDKGFLVINHDGQDCFVQETYQGSNYCVPNSAANTKKIFSLIRQFTGVLTQPSGQSATNTVRTIGQ